MREIRPSGSEGGVGRKPYPYPYQALEPAAVAEPGGGGRRQCRHSLR